MAHVTIDRTVLPWRPWDVGLAKSGVGKLLYGILANEPRRGGYGAVGRERCEGVIHFVEDGNVKVAEVAWPWHKVGHDLALAFASQLVTTGEKPSRMRSRRRCQQAGAVRQGFATVAI